MKDLAAVFAKQKELFDQEPYPSLTKRKQALLGLKKWLQEDASAISEAINQDFSHRAVEESLFLEIYPAIKAIDYCLKQLKKWMRAQKRHVPWYMKPAQALVLAQPLGVVGIIVPWNYPIYLSIVPLVYALAAGNRVMIKFSEYTPVTGSLFESFIKSSSLPVHVVNGDVAIAKSFSALPFGHLLFTGSTPVGKQVMAAASKNLTPVTLELGGKSPAIISKTANRSYLQRLFMGKLFNAGQTCIAPDYLLIPKDLELGIEKSFTDFMRRCYPDLQDNKDYSSIISESQKQRLESLLADAKEKGARIVQFGEVSARSRCLPVTLLFNVNQSMLIMQQEIFGPLLPVLTYDSFDEAVATIHSMPNPLALYYFGENKDEINRLKFKTLSGALTINDTIMQIAIDDLPFGGAGLSGLGHYHGQEGFNTFSKIKPIFLQKRWSAVTWFYPPYGKLIHYFLRYFGGIKLKEKK